MVPYNVCVLRLEALEGLGLCSVGRRAKGNVLCMEDPPGSGDEMGNGGCQMGTIVVVYRNSYTWGIDDVGMSGGGGAAWRAGRERGRMH